MTATIRRQANLLLLLALVTATLVTNAAPAAAIYKYQNKPLDDIKYWAGRYSADVSDMTTNEIAAIMVVTTLWESGAGEGSSPSPMTLSRGDVDKDLYFNGSTSTTTPRHFWNPGIGLFQIDHGIASWDGMTAFHRIDAYYAAKSVIEHQIGFLKAAGVSKADRRANAWGRWYGCNGTRLARCQTAFSTIYNSSNDTLSITTDTVVDNKGGMTLTTCRYYRTTTEFPCWYVDHTKATGLTSNWTYAPLSGGASGTTPSPLAARFYMQWTTDYEYHQWQSNNGGHSKNQYVRRAKTSTPNPRTTGSLSYNSGPNPLFCEKSWSGCPSGGIQ